MKTVSFLIEKVDGGYTAYAQDFSILAEGDTLNETYRHATEAFEEQCEFMSDNPNDYRIEFKYDLPTLFDVYQIVNVKALAELSVLLNIGRFKSRGCSLTLKQTDK